jgi:ribose/xylose/arabinose/galactoside ABC-type transport system permease subunit
MAASFLGSSMFYPGRVNLIGTFVGSIFMGFILNFLTILGIKFYFVPLTQGILLLLGVGVATMRNRSIKQIKL